ncbi:MAG: CcmD family protein [Bacteroidota bacterium]|nr:CcmD family protein [Bacteroidota bacterium]
MMNKRLKLKYFLLGLFTCHMSGLFAQTPSSMDLEAEQWLEANAKFHVVIAVLVLIFIGLVVYLLWLDRKVSKLEKES